jgi:hypothetical protein
MSLIMERGKMYEKTINFLRETYHKINESDSSKITKEVVLNIIADTEDIAVKEKRIAALNLELGTFNNIAMDAICFSPNELHGAALAAGLNDTDIDDLIREASKRHQ